MGLFRQHVESRYPNSKHWDPEKIQPSSRGIGVEIDIPGAGRAWHDVTIKPVKGSWLAIPLLALAKGTSPRDQEGLFRPWRSGGGGKMNVLAKKTSGGALVFMYALAKKAFQKQDPSLLPTEEQTMNTIFEAYSRKLADELGGTLS